MQLQKKQPPIGLPFIHRQSRYRTLLLATLALSIILRLIAVFHLGNEVVALPGTADQQSYHNLALRLIAGYGFTFGEAWWPQTPAGDPTAHWSYLYTFYLAAVYAASGAYPLLARLIQAVIVGLLQPYLAYRLGRHTFGEAVGLVAALLTAVYSYFVYYAATLMTEPFYITAIMAGLYLAILLAEDLRQENNGRRSYKLTLLLGLILGITVLLRQLYLLVIPFIFLWIWWVGRGPHALSPRHIFTRPSGGQRRPALPLSAFRPDARVLARLLLSTAVLVALILPFTLYNAHRFDRFVLLNTNAGYAFFWANHPIYGHQFQPILPSEMGSYQSLIPVELRHLDEAALDQALLRRGIQFVVDEPGRYLILSLSRLPAYFMFWPSSDSGLTSNIARVTSFGLLWPFMLVGTARFLRRGQLLSLVQHPGSLLILYAIIYSLIHLLSWALIRYRLPVDAILLIFAGSAVVDLLEFSPWSKKLATAFNNQIGSITQSVRRE